MNTPSSSMQSAVAGTPIGKRVSRICEDHNAQYTRLRDYISKSLEAAAAAGITLFVVDRDGLGTDFLLELPLEIRQHYNCRTCLSFLDKALALVYVDDKLNQIPYIADRVLNGGVVGGYFGAFAKSFQRVNTLAKRATITDVFMPEGTIMGDPMKGGWTHFHAYVPAKYRHVPTVKTAEQVQAALRQDFQTLARFLASPKARHLGTASSIFDGDVRHRDIVKPRIDWLLRIQAKVATLRYDTQYHRYLWTQVSAAPAGWCSVSSSILGAVLEDLAMGRTQASVLGSFAKKVAPTKYMRPTGEAQAGNVAQADKVFDKLNAHKALERRLALLSEVPDKLVLFRPTGPMLREESLRDPGSHMTHTPGTFSRALGTPERKYKDLGKMSFARFRREVLDSEQVQAMQVSVASQADHFYAFTTGPIAGFPILQWDTLEDPNPLAWYTYSGGGLMLFPTSLDPRRWSLTPGWTDVEAVTCFPNMERGGTSRSSESLGLGVLFALKGCDDQGSRTSGIALFPQFLRSDLHAVRRSIERLSSGKRMGRPAGAGPLAQGVGFRSESKDPRRVRWTTRGGQLRSATIVSWD